MVMGARKFILLTIFVVLLGTSREVWAQKISIHMNNATLEEVLKKIKKKTKYDMMYQMKDVKEIDSRRSVHFDETELQEVLTFCLQGLPLDFRIYNQTIIITKKNDSHPRNAYHKGSHPGRGRNHAPLGHHFGERK